MVTHCPQRQGAIYAFIKKKKKKWDIYRLYEYAGELAQVTYVYPGQDSGQSKQFK